MIVRASVVHLVMVGCLGAVAQPESNILCIANPGKGQNSQCEVWSLLNMYHFRTIVKPKNIRLSHH